MTTIPPEDEKALRKIADREIGKAYRKLFGGKFDASCYEAHFWRILYALGRASGWRDGAEAQREADVRAMVIHKPHGTYNSCRLCGSTWWDDEREGHHFRCATTAPLVPYPDDQRAKGKSDE